MRATSPSHLLLPNSNQPNPALIYILTPLLLAQSFMSVFPQQLRLLLALKKIRASEQQHWHVISSKIQEQVFQGRQIPVCFNHIHYCLWDAAANVVWIMETGCWLETADI